MAEKKQETPKKLRTGKFGLRMGSHVQLDQDGKERLYSAMDRNGVRLEPVFESTRDLAKRDSHKFVRLRDDLPITPEKGRLCGKDAPPDTSDLIEDDVIPQELDDGYEKMTVEQLLEKARMAEVNVGAERSKEKLIKMLRDACVLA